MKNGTLKKVLSYLSGYWLLLVMLIIFSLSFSLISLYIPILVGEAIDLIVEEDNVDTEGLIPIIGEMVFFALAAALSQWLVSIIGNKITFSTVRDIRRDAFQKLLRLPLSYIDSHRHGETVSRIIQDAGQFADGLIMSFTQLFTGVVTIVATIVFMININLKISLIVILLTPLSLFVASFIAKNTYSMFKKQTETRGELTGIIDEMIGGQRLYVLFPMKREQKRNSIRSILFSKSIRLKLYSFHLSPIPALDLSIVWSTPLWEALALLPLLPEG